MPRALRRTLVEEARRAAPRECCGLLLGTTSEVRYAVPLRNAAPGTRRFRVDPADHIGVRRWVRRLTPGLEICGVYHSHPASRAEPSDTDVAEAAYAEWLHVIVGLGGRRTSVRGFRISGGRVAEVRLAWR